MKNSPGRGVRHVNGWLNFPTKEVKGKSDQVCVVKMVPSSAAPFSPQFPSTPCSQLLGS